MARLRSAGCGAEAHDAHFAQNAPDPEWMKAAGKNRWLVLTGDRHLQWNEAELAAIYFAKAAVFQVTLKQHRTAEVIADAVVKALKRIASLVAIQKRPFVASVSSSGAVNVLLDSAKIAKLLRP